MGKQNSCLNEVGMSNVKAQGWIKRYFETQAKGLTGNIDKIGGPFVNRYWGNYYAQNIQNADNVFLGGMEVKKVGWVPFEQTAYWIDGMIRCGYLSENDELIEKAKDCILKKFEACKDKYIDLSTKINEGKFSEDDYRESQSDELSIVHIFEDTIIMLSKHLSKIIRSANIENLTEIDGKLSEFCSLNGLSYPETCDNKLTVSHPSVNSNAFSLQKIFGESISHSKHKIDFTNEIIECIKSHVTDKNKTSNILFTRDTQEFSDYIDNTDFRKKIGNTLEIIEQNSIAIYKDEKFDLHLTIKGIIAVNKTVRITPISRRKILEIFLYKEVKIDNDRIILTQYVYPIPPSIADIFKKIISDINRIAAKYKPADEKEDHTAIGELLSALRWNIDNDFEYSTLDELKINFSNFGNHELEEMLYSGQFKENIKLNNALKNVLKERGYADDYIDSLEN